MGELLVAKRHFATALARYEPERHQALAFGHLLFEPRLSMLAWQSIGLWLSGQLDESLRVSKLALAEALELGHVHTLAHMLFTAGIALEQARRDPAAVAPHLRRALRLMEDNQLSMFRAYATYDEGWLLAEHGQYDDGIARMHAGLEAMRTTGTGAFRPQFLGWLAWAYAQSGRIAPALGVLDEALRATESGGEHWWEAELYRLKGEALLLAGTDRTAAEAYLRSAIEVARRQQAVILELRAATSLYRALAHRGTGADAGDLVACALGRIQGGDATRDVCEARAVLAERVHS
jgi:adenylate cyclase